MTNHYANIRHFGWIIVLLGIFLPEMSLQAQESQVATLTYQRGDLKFHYYEKNDTKVPDGEMEFTRKNYSEKGVNKDGYKEGEWLQIVKNKSGKLLKEAKFNYQNGMLEGKTYIKQLNTLSDKPNDYSEAEYNFHEGHLIGENKIINHKDTIWCNFDENGNKIGQWKYSGYGRVIIIEFDNNNPDGGIAYEVDILGQKTPMDFGNGYHPFVIPIINFNDNFTKEPFSWPQDVRVKLPTLHENKYGVVQNQLKSIQENKRGY